MTLIELVGASDIMWRLAAYFCLNKFQAITQASHSQLFCQHFTSSNSTFNSQHSTIEGQNHQKSIFGKKWFLFFPTFRGPKVALFSSKNRREQPNPLQKCQHRLIDHNFATKKSFHPKFDQNTSGTSCLRALGGQTRKSHFLEKVGGSFPKKVQKVFGKNHSQFARKRVSYTASSYMR